MRTGSPEQAARGTSRPLVAPLRTTLRTTGRRLTASILFVRPLQVDLGQAHLLGDRTQLVAHLEHAGGPLGRVEAQAGDDQLVESGGDARVDFKGGTSFRSSPGLRMPCWANRPVNMRYIVAPRL